MPEGRLLDARGKVSIQADKAREEKNCLCVKFVVEGGELGLGLN